MARRSHTIDCLGGRRRSEPPRTGTAEVRAGKSRRHYDCRGPPHHARDAAAEFFRQHAIERLALKTTERYRELAAALAPELMAMTLGEITPLHPNREWNRLLKSGRHHRSTKAPRALSAKTVRNIAGLASSAFSRAIKWGLIATNPVTNSEPPRVRKYLAIALTPAQLAMVLESASGPWCIRTYLELASATGCRRGELPALRWSDIVDGRAMIARSLTQTRDVLGFKCTKTEKPRPVRLPESAIVALEAHRQQRDEFRRQFGPDYRADLDLIFANPDGTMLKPDSISASVSALFKRLKFPKPKGAALHLLRHSHTSHLLAVAYHSRRCPRGSGIARCGRRRKSTDT
jgi:integrase